MTQDEKSLFEVTISKVKNSASSIFSKDDVLDLLTTLESGYTKEQIIDAVKDLLSNYSFEEFVNCEPELQGSYGDSYSLEMNTSFDDRDFTRSFIAELEDYFIPNKEQL